jgi:hypothetical protein
MTKEQRLKRLIMWEAVNRVPFETHQRCCAFRQDETKDCDCSIYAVMLGVMTMTESEFLQDELFKMRFGKEA